MSDFDKFFAFDGEALLNAARASVLGNVSKRKWSIPDCDVDDIIGETVTKAWKSRHSYDPAKGAFKTWVGKIALNCIWDYFRSRDSRKVVEFDCSRNYDLPTAKAPDSLMMEKERLDIVMNAADTLKGTYRDVIYLLSREMDTEEMTVILGFDSQKVHRQRFLARVALRSKLGCAV